MSHTAPLRSSWTCMVIVGTSFSQHQRLRQDLVQKRTDTGIDAFADRASVVLGGQCVRVQFGLQWRRVLPPRTVKFALLQAQTVCGVPLRIHQPRSEQLKRAVAVHLYRQRAAAVSSSTRKRMLTSGHAPVNPSAYG